MEDADRTIVAGNGTVVEAGGVYLTFSGDSGQPYAVVKVVSIGSGPDGVGWDCQIAPDLTPVESLDLWLKLFYANHTEPPSRLPSAAEPFRIMPMSVNMFLAWGPPKFPIRVGTQAVTPEELAARIADWHKQGPRCQAQPDLRPN
jgi:hypothetical protein